VRQKHLHDALFRRTSGAKLGAPAEHDLLAFAKGDADSEEIVVGDADDVAGEGLFGERAIVSQAATPDVAGRQAPHWHASSSGGEL